MSALAPESDSFFLHNKTIIISGASSGIGRKVALSAAERGARLLLIGRNSEKLAEIASMLPQGTAFEILEYNLNSSDGLDSALAERIMRLGPVDGLVHSAGIASTIPLRLLNRETMMSELSINTIAGMELMRICSSKKLVSRNGASFVMVSSVTAIRGTVACAGYAASKAALSGLVKSSAVELAKKKIRVNSVLLGYVCNTGITSREFGCMTEEAKEAIARKHPLGIGTVDDVVPPILFLLSDAAKWITGAEIAVDGGYSI